MSDMSVDLKTRPEMPKQPPAERISNFSEVALGYTEEQAVAEAGRCLNCKRPPCVENCPVGVDIPAFVGRIADLDFDAAARILKDTNSLPAICGRVCPQETQCEAACVLGKRGDPIAIGALERFAADVELESGVAIPDVQATATSGRSVAVVGAGPSGLTAAAELAKMGHAVTVFESLHAAGGVLTYGIPEFRLPKSIVQAEVEFIESLGVQILLNSVIGKIETVDELLLNYDAVFLGTGAGLPMFLGIDGENLNGVYSANEFLTRVNLMKAYRFPQCDTPVASGGRVVVVGGGNVAMDAARCAVRLGADEVVVAYRRGEEELPARAEEIQNAKEEGIIFRLLTNPTRILGDGQNRAIGVACVSMKLCEPDESGRCRPVALSGTEHVLPADTVIIAVGTSPNPLVPMTTPGLETTRYGTVVADENGATSKRGVFAGGDVVTGSATVISAMGAGKVAARVIDERIR
jgi:glutamate synthase (NADPH/NADH) small chain